MTDAKLSIQHLSKTFTDRTGAVDVLSDLSLHVKSGEFVSIIGPSGCGKSTLFHIIAGVDEPTGGEILVDGQARQSQERLGLSGYLPQKPLLLPWKTIRENVLLSAWVQRQPAATAGRAADQLLQKFGLADFADRYPVVLSGGMAQRAAVARTILANGDLLLMDEPFGALDALTRQAMQQWLLAVWGELGCSLLFITHDIREAILLSDRIYVFGKRPGTVIKEVTVNLPRPRRRVDLATKPALALETELERLLLGL